MNDHMSNCQVPRDGFAMATTLLVVLVLSVIAVGAAWLASMEKRTSFAESVHISALYSADAGGESAINFLRLSEAPPAIQDFVDLEVASQDETEIHGEQAFEYSCHYVSKRPRPGWGVEYLDYDYRIDSDGAAAGDGRSNIQLVASRLYRDGY
ncbi:MAG: PilX N-terminal domain-containing pilus assembly protein [bacterium]